MKKILMVCPSLREKREIELSGLDQRYAIDYHVDDDAFFEKRFYHEEPGDPPFDLRIHIEKRLAQLKQANYDGILSALDHPGAALAAIYARGLDLPGPDPDLVIRCQHKFEARKQQARLVPDAVPNFALLHPNQAGVGQPPLPFPFFIKPVKGRFSAFSRPILNEVDWRSLQGQTLLPPAAFRRGFNALLEYLDDVEGDADYLLAESLLSGEQVTLDGFVTGGKVQVLDIVDSYMYPNTISFSCFQLPSRLPQSALQRMKQVATTYIEGIGLNETMFNIEFFHNPENGDVHIIEMNPRLASGFADLYEKVHGLNLFDLGMSLAAGQVKSFTSGNGDFQHAASFVARVFQDQYVSDVPSSADIARVMELFPEARIEISATKGRYLSDKMQDLASFRYALVHLGAASVPALEAKHEHALSLLPFEFTTVSPTYPTAVEVG